ncbi:MAG: hypothetical protein ACOX66_08495 [Oscillospiraceae bacterium]
MALIGKLKYVGPTFSFGLTGGKVYDCTEIDACGWLRIIDDDSWGEDKDGYLYLPTSPGPIDDQTIRGRWVIVEDFSNGELRKLIPA